MILCYLLYNLLLHYKPRQKKYCFAALRSCSLYTHCLSYKCFLFGLVDIVFVKSFPKLLLFIPDCYTAEALWEFLLLEEICWDLRQQVWTRCFPFLWGKMNCRKQERLGLGLGRFHVKRFQILLARRVSWETGTERIICLGHILKKGEKLFISHLCPDFPIIYGCLQNR